MVPLSPVLVMEVRRLVPLVLLTICFQGRVVRRFRGASTLLGAIAPLGWIIGDRPKQGGGEASETYVRDVSSDPLASGFTSCFGTTQERVGGLEGWSMEWGGGFGSRPWGLLLVG